MAFGFVGSIGGNADSGTANKSSYALTTTAACNAGDLIVIIIGVDNSSTSDGFENAVSGITDSSTGGNTWTRADEWTNSRGAAQAGATCSIWFSVIVNSIASGGTITAAFNNATSRDAASIQGGKFSIGAGSTVALDTTNTPTRQLFTGSFPADIDYTSGNGERLRLMCGALETNNASNPKITDSPDVFAPFGQDVASTGGGSAANMGQLGQWAISTGTNLNFHAFSGISADSVYIYVALVETTAAPFSWYPMDSYSAEMSVVKQPIKAIPYHTG